VDCPAFLIGNAPSLKDLDLSLLKDHFTIGINRAFYEIDPTILMWQDAELWWNHRAEISRLKAIKYCKNLADPKNRCYHFKLSNGDFKLTDTASMLYGRGATGPLAFQLAHVLGCDPIFMLGMDCCYREGKTDFYGVNPSHKSHTRKNCNKGLKWIKMCNSDREIYACSHSKIFDSPISLEDAVDMCRSIHPQNRSIFRSKILGSSK